MIGYLEGSILDVNGNELLIKTNTGVGYFVIVPPTQLYEEGKEISIFTLEVYQEKKASQLFGFQNIKDKKWVEQLTKVGGVGPKTAATIVYTHGGEKIAQAITTGDDGLFKAVKGLGAKTAKKIILELKGSIEDVDVTNTAGEPNRPQSNFVSNFTETLKNMGYRQNEIIDVISKMKKEKVWDEDNAVKMIKLALKKI